MAKVKTAERYVRIRCSACKRVNYDLRKNKRKVERKLELIKYCKWCRKQTLHKEARK
ncbi:MAG: 50S ribosomal protein L33 [Parcubacteria group bacterium]|nr:50S ribosomal protein L33 [Parcubacteria group bacterium]